jgi:dephospho-CoA kinase
MAALRQIPVIGILGGVGAGKSTVAAELARLGCEVIDADAIGHELLKDQDAQKLLRDQWGPEIFSADGQVDRPALAAKVFGDPEALARLNRILHPRIRERIGLLIEQARRCGVAPAVALDAAVLLEAGWDEFCTHCIFVRTGDELRAARAAGRGWDRRAWRLRENSQISLDTKAGRCEYTVENSSSAPHLREQVRRIYQNIIGVSDHR